MKFFCSCLAITSSIFLSSTSYAQIIANPSNIVRGDSVYEGFISFSEVEYEDDISYSRDSDIDRKIVGASVSSDFNEGINLFGQAGFILEAEDEPSNEEGMGWMFGVGPKFSITESSDYTVVGHGMFNYINETYDDAPGEPQLTIWDLHGGATASFKLSSDRVQPYAGIDLVLKSDGEVEYDGGTETNIERDDILSVKFGATLKLDSITIRPEATIMGEQTITIAFSSN
jgi:hypothetical protein